MHRLSRTGRVRAQRRANVRVGWAPRSTYSFFNVTPSAKLVRGYHFGILHPPAPATRAIEFLIKQPIIQTAEQWAKLAPSQTYINSKLRSRLAHHPNSGLQGGVDREGGLGGP